jgi:diguanylate cyclase (GGDEF)-like protein
LEAQGLDASMHSSRWRFIVGPLITVATGIAIMIVDRYVMRVPNPGALHILSILVSAYIGGIIPGLVSAAITLGFGLTFLRPEELFGLNQHAVFRFVTLLVVAPAAAVIVGLLRGRERRAIAEERRNRERVEAANRNLLALHSALDMIDNGVVLLDADMRARFINRKFRDTWNFPDEKADANPFFHEIMSFVQETEGYDVRGEELTALVARRLAMAEAGDSTPVDLRRADGRVIRAQYAALPDGGRLLTYTEVTDLVRHAEKLEEANRALATVHAALNHVDAGLMLLDEKFKVQFMNEAFRELWGIAELRATGKESFAEGVQRLLRTNMYGIPAEQFEAFTAERLRRVRDGDPTPMDLRRADGRIVRARCSVLPGGGRMLSYVDVTDIVRRTDELERLRAALEYVDEGVVLLDAELRARFMNAASRRIGGLRERAPGEWPHYAELIEEVAGNLAYAVPEGELAAFVTARKAFVASGDPTPVEMRMAGGGVFRFRCAALPDGGRMLLYSDITDLVRQAEQLEKLATIDGLSGLYNRRHFLTLADGEWSRYARHGRPLALIALDIDHFKAINDRFGHDAGDRVIAHVANLCRADRRPSDVVARVGGEEFAVMLPETELAAAGAVAERLRARIAGNAFVSDAVNLSLSASLGVAVAGPGVDSVAALMKEADRALYEAKRSGRNRVVVAGEARLVAAPEATLQPAEARAAAERLIKAAG